MTSRSPRLPTRSSQRCELLGSEPPGTRTAFVASHDGTRLYVRQRRTLRSTIEGPEFQGNPRRGLVLCDGILCDGYIYKWLWGEPPLQTPVVHWNYRGHGRSENPRDPEAVNVEDHARDLLKVIEFSQFEEVVLVGHSFGVTVVLEALRMQPRLAKGAVLISGTARPLAEVFRGEEKLFGFISTLQKLVRSNPRLARGVWARLPAGPVAKLAMAMGELSKELNPDDIRPYFEHLSRLEPEFSLRLLHAAGHHAVGDLSGIDAPCLVIAGDRDTFVPASESRRLTDELKQAQFHLIEGGTHAAPIEYPELFSSRIGAFLRQLGFSDD